MCVHGMRAKSKCTTSPLTALPTAGGGNRGSVGCSLCWNGTHTPLRPPSPTQQGRPKPALSRGSPACACGPRAFRQRGLRSLTAACSGSRGWAPGRGMCEAHPPPALGPRQWSSEDMSFLQYVLHGPHTDSQAAVDVDVYLGCASLPPRPASCKHHVPSLSSLSTEVAFCNQF